MSNSETELRSDNSTTHQDCAINNADIPQHIQIHRSWRSVLPQIGLTCLLTSIVVVLGIKIPALYGATISLKLLGTTHDIVLPFSPLVFAIFFGRAVFLMRDSKYILGLHHLYATAGLYSFRKEHIEIPFEDILGIRCHQSLPERILNVGTVVAWTATSERPEIVFKGIGDPEKVVSLIRQRLDNTIIEGKHGPKHPKRKTE